MLLGPDPAKPGARGLSGPVPGLASALPAEAAWWG